MASFNGGGVKVKDLLNVIKREAPEFFKRVKGRAGFDGVGGVGIVRGAESFSFQGSQKFIVEIVTDPAGAVPTVDGKAFQKCTSTPCKVQIEAGEHRFVASMDRYDDAETVVAVTGNNQQVVLDLTPNFGYLNLRPGLMRYVGRTSNLRMTIDGMPAKYGMNELVPGVHAVKIEHPCYDPAEFEVAIEKQKSETFNENLKRGIGGLVLEAEWNGEPQAVPVYVDGKEVGSTPFEGEVPMCAEVAVMDGDKRKTVAVDLRWHDVAKTSYRLENKPGTVAIENAASKDAPKTEADVTRERAAAAYAELDGKTLQAESAPQTQVGESVPANIEQKPGVRWVPVIASGVALLTGTVLAVVGNSKAKSAYDRDITSEADYKKNRDDAQSGQTLRAVGGIMAIFGAVGIGVSFVF